MSGGGAKAAASWHKVLSGSSSPRRCCTPTPSTSSWRWVSWRGALCTGVCRRRLVVLSDGGWIRPCAWSRVLRQLRVLWLAGEWIDLDFPAARVDGEVRSMVGGARGVSRLTFFHRRFYPGLRVGWLLRLLSKLPWDGVPPDLGLPWSFLHRRRLATDRRRRSLEASGSRGFHMVQGLFCNLCFSQGPLCKLVGQLSLYPPTYLYSYVYLYIFHNQ